MRDGNGRTNHGQESAAFSRRLFALVLPIALQNLISALVSSADVVMIAGVSQSALSAVSLAGQVTFVLMLFYFGISTGAGILTAQYWGKGDLRAIDRVLGIGLRSVRRDIGAFLLCGIASAGKPHADSDR